MTTHSFLVCPHDTAANPVRWQLLAQYLSQKLNVSFCFEITFDFAEFHERMESADLVYANPLDTLHLTTNNNFTALTRPSNMYDEAVLVANPDIADPSVDAIQGQPIASVCSMLPTKIALRMLDKQSVKPSDVVDHDSWTAVISTVWRNDVSYGIVYKDTYDELSDQGKGMVQLLATTQEHVAFHSFVAGNNAVGIKDDIQQTLLAMHTDSKCQEMLQEFCFEQWVAVTSDELDAMRLVGGVVVTLARGSCGSVRGGSPYA